jgi:hypothetical protein
LQHRVEVKLGNRRVAQLFDGVGESLVQRLLFQLSEIGALDLGLEDNDLLFSGLGRRSDTKRQQGRESGQGKAQAYATPGGRKQGGTTGGLHGVLCDGVLSGKERLHDTACHLNMLSLTTSAAFVLHLPCGERLGSRLDVLKQRRDALPDTDAHRRQAVALTAAPQLMR